MEANELRIGNYVEWSTPTSSINIKELLHKINLKDLVNFEENKVLLEPIPLTEEWFEKFEFYKDDEYWSRDIYDYKYCFKYRDWAKNWAFYQEFTDSPNSHDNGVKYPVSFDIEFVHQLQNLWFSLQHEELKIKE